MSELVEMMPLVFLPPACPDCRVAVHFDDVGFDCPKCGAWWPHQEGSLGWRDRRVSNE